MDKKQFVSTVKTELKDGFFGKVPSPFSKVISNEVISNYYAFSKKYETIDVYKLDYANYVHDFLKSLFPSIEKAIGSKKTVSESEIKKMQFHGRAFIGQDFYTKIHGNVLSIQEKHSLCYFMYYFLDTARKMYGFDFIDNQKEFLDDIGKMAAIFLRVLQLQNAAILNKSLISEYWVHTPEQLTSLSEKLHQIEFTHCSQCFSQGFDKNVDSYCNWMKGRPALMYLLWLLFIEKQMFPNPILKQVLLKFKFDGVPIEQKVLNTQKGKVQDNFHTNELLLKGQFLEVYNVYCSVFGKPKIKSTF